MQMRKLKRRMSELEKKEEQRWRQQGEEQELRVEVNIAGLTFFPWVLAKTIASPPDTLHT